ncbi:hypothetical protein MAR_025381 [Mya arenaria]|uniref:Uncharacterized protein n=1 Tax=Mya arenaria TaxID=6604 RepID=A0ABY7DXY5_MYAAR|nr:hypothetical protein MAR_025381 [Mya arenaria]
MSLAHVASTTDMGEHISHAGMPTEFCGLTGGTLADGLKVDLGHLSPGGKSDDGGLYHHDPGSPDDAAKAPPYAVHAGSAERAGTQLRQDSLPRHLHEGGAGSPRRPYGVASTGAHKFMLYYDVILSQTFIAHRPYPLPYRTIPHSI